MKADAKSLFRSPLVRAMLVGFAVIAVTQLSFLMALCYDALWVEKRAAKEHTAVMLTQELTMIADLLLQHRRIMDKDRLEHGEAAGAAQAYQRAQRINHDMSVMQTKWKTSGLPQEGMNTIGQDIAKVSSDSIAMYADSTTAEQRDLAYANYLESSKHLYATASNEISKLRRFVDLEAVTGHSKGIIEPRSFLLGALVVNVLFLLIALRFVVSKLCSPINKMTSECSHLLKAEPIAKPPHIKNEIDALWQTFYQMSLQASEDEQKRRSYLRLVKEAQSAAIHEAKDTIDGFKSATWISSSAANDLDVLSRNTTGIIGLLDSLDEGLSYRDGGTIELNKKPVEAQSILDHAAEAVDALARRRKVNIQVQTCSGTLYCDPDYLHRALVNVLSNAVKFTPADRRVYLKATSEANSTTFEIMDEGPGISESDQSKLFKRFSQLRDDRAVGGIAGSGLGLVISKEIVEAHGGTIGLESRLGAGTKFKITLPTQQARIAKGRSQSAAQSRRSGMSMQYKFAALLLMFIVLQTVLAVGLSGKYDEAEAAAKQYARQKQVIVRTQSLLTLFLDTREIGKEGILNNDVNKFMSVVPLLRQQTALCNSLVNATTATPELNDALKTLLARLKSLHGVVIRALRGLYGGMPMEIEYAKQAAETGGMAVERLIFKSLQLEDMQFQRAYDVGDKIQSQIIMTLLITAVIDAAFISLIIAYGLSILSKVAALNAKAQSFAEGGRPVASIGGSDEVAWLDQKLCLVAGMIRDAEDERQQLAAVINHDLRTPLCSVLAAFEMMADGIHGTPTASDADKLNNVQARLWQLVQDITAFLDQQKAAAAGTN